MAYAEAGGLAEELVKTDEDKVSQIQLEEGVFVDRTISHMGRVQVTREWPSRFLSLICDY